MESGLERLSGGNPTNRDKTQIQLTKPVIASADTRKSEEIYHMRIAAVSDLRATISYENSTANSWKSSRNSINFKESIVDKRASQGKFLESEAKPHDGEQILNLRDSFRHSTTSSSRGSGKFAEILEEEMMVADYSSDLISSTTEKYKYIGRSITTSSGERLRHGFGVCYYNTGDKYVGNWRLDKKEGWGVLTINSHNKVFKGEFRANVIDGFVEHQSRKGLTMIGVMKGFKFVDNSPMIIKHPSYTVRLLSEFDQNLKRFVGVGTIRYKNYSFYQGEITESQETGWGVLRRADNYTFRGFKSDGKYNDYCEIVYPDQSKFFGWFKNNKMNGIGIWLKTDGTYTLGKYADDFREGGFLSLYEGEAKFELYLAGFPTKVIDEKEKIVKYVSLVYPECKWLCLTNNKVICEKIFRYC